MQFYVGLHQTSDAKHFDRAFISVTRLRRLKSPFFVVKDWIMDSGAFSTLRTHGGYPQPVEEYADEIARWVRVGQLRAVVTQDYMCEPFMLALTGLTVPEHQALTIERYDRLRALVSPSVYVMPVLQGYAPSDYVSHIAQYGHRLAPRAWVGVGSICKRNGTPAEVVALLRAIKQTRPDLRLHGFGLKITALESSTVCQYLDTADSMAWSFRARKHGWNQNDWREAEYFVREIELLLKRSDTDSLLPFEKEQQ